MKAHLQHEYIENQRKNKKQNDEENWQNFVLEKYTKTDADNFQVSSMLVHGYRAVENERKY